jgi:hypothetical protein
MKVAELKESVETLENGDGVLIVVPSMTFDREELAKIPGFVHFEERMLWLLQVLRNPRAKVIYVTSQRLPEGLANYSADLTGDPTARNRVITISCDDPEPISLTQKVLNRRDVQNAIEAAALGGTRRVMMCHIATQIEAQLAASLKSQLFANPPELMNLGSKSASRHAFRAAGVGLPDGAEDLRDRADAVEALDELRGRIPDIRRAVIKLNESFAGGGNAVVTFPSEVSSDLNEMVSDAKFVAEDESSDRYFDAFAKMGGIVEQYIEGDVKTSPSAQCIIAPNGTVRVIATHEQILGGEAGQTYFGCHFPAAHVYSRSIGKSAASIGKVLAAQGVIGHVSIDFVCVMNDTEWMEYAIEVNLRMGGTTAPISFLEAATGAQYRPDTGSFLDHKERELFYTSADRAQQDTYRQLNTDALLDLADAEKLHFDRTTGQGSVFYMLGALPSVGKLGLVAVDKSPGAAKARYDATLEKLDQIMPYG